jgi:cobalt-precorrin 5A hydrolase/precorrin-3B C17-methyltransferase
VLARNLGREGESVMTVPLSGLEVGQVDMLTLVLVGASTTRQLPAGGRTWTYTPRGYANKCTGGCASRAPGLRDAAPPERIE